MSSTHHRQNAALAYLILRLALGLDILMHGMVRLGNVGAFVSKTGAQFARTPLPGWMATSFLTALPFAEAAIGTLLLLGLFLRFTLLAGSLLMMALMFGTALNSDWNVIAIQLFYVLIYAILAAAQDYNRFSLDRWRRNASPSGSA